MGLTTGMSTLTPLTVIRGQYVAPLEEVNAARDAHLAFIAGLVAERGLLMAGRRTPPEGSILVFRGDDPEGVLALFADDPYVTAGVAEYELVGVFTPGSHAPELAAFLSA